MEVFDRREREREQLRTRITEAARDILSEQGLDALSMRAIAERIEYSAATIYLYFKDKHELLRSVVEEGFERLHATMQAELDAAGPEAGPLEQYAATGRAYAIFGLEHTAYFRVMFELPTVAQMECPAEVYGEDVPEGREKGWNFVVGIVQRAVDAGIFQIPDAARGALIGWGLIHGLTALYLSGHLRGRVGSREDFLALIEETMDALYQGWRNPALREAARPAEAGRAVETAGSWSS